MRRCRKHELALAIGLLALICLFFWRGGDHGAAPAASEMGDTPPPRLARPPESSLPMNRATAFVPDRDAAWEELPNGFRFVIFPRPSPPGRVSMRLLVEAGSLMEADDQQGVAHFVEHMAFNGTRNFPPEEAMERFERMGMRPGADTNARTSFDHTVYQLDLPENDGDLLAEAFLFLRDVADGILFSPDQVESERKVLLSEARARRERGDLWERVWKGLLPESLLARRFPIGTDEVLENVGAARLIDFYRTYYTARRMVLVVAGDVDFADTRARVAEGFGSLPDVPRAADPDIGKVALDRGVVAFANLPGETTAYLVAVHPLEEKPDSPELRHARLVRDLANSTVGLRRMAGESASPFMSSGWQQPANLAGAEILRFSVRPGQWRADVSNLAREWRRLRDFGFTPDAFAMAKTRLLEAAIRRMQWSVNRDSRDLADGIVESHLAKRVHLAPEDEFALVLTALRDVTREETEAAYRQAWDSEDVGLFLPADVDLKQNEEIVSHLEAGWVQPIVRLLDDPKPTLDLAPTGAPGEVISRERIDDIGMTAVTFSNQVRMNFKQIGTVAGVYDVRVAFGGGRLSAPPDQHGICEWMTSLFSFGGLPEASDFDIRRATAGSVMTCSLALDEGAFLLEGMATADVMRNHLALLCARLTRTDWMKGEKICRTSGKRELALLVAMSQFTNLESVVSRSLIPALAGGDRRLDTTFGAEVLGISAEAVREWLRPAILDSPMEITIVGDVTLAYAEAMVAETFGALPGRTPVTAQRSAFDPGEWKAGKVEEFPFRTSDLSDTPLGEKSARLILALPCDSRSTPVELRRLVVLARILEIRLHRELRERRGESYACTAKLESHLTLGGLAYLRITVDPKLSRLEEVAGLARAVMATMAAGGVTEDERIRAVRPMLMGREQLERNPRYWLLALDRGGLYPEGLAFERSARKDLEEVTVADLNTLARKYLDPARAREFRYLPEE